MGALLTMPPADEEITTGELSRNLQGIRKDISDWRGEMTRTLAGFVSMQLYQSEMSALRGELARIEAEAKARSDAEAHERDQDRAKWARWQLAFFTGIIAPVAVALIVGAFVIKAVG